MAHSEDGKRQSPLSLPDFSGVSSEALYKVLQACEKGKSEEVIQSFEADFSSLVGSKYAISVSSATAGLHLALLALGVKAGDEVLCPTFTFAASAFPVVYQQATPVFVDSEKDTWNMSPEYLEMAILDRLSKGRSIKAIVVVHSYGTPARLESLLTIAAHYQIPVIEDAANALGSTWKGQQVGGFGTIGVFSFNRNKIISAAGGGCVVTNDEGLARQMRYLAHQAKTQANYYLHEAVGYNYGVSPLLAELVRLQLSHLPIKVKERIRSFEAYKTVLPEKALYQQECSDTVSNRWLSVFSGNLVAEKLRQTTYKVWKPLHTQPVFEQFPYYGNKESEQLFENAFCLPFSSSL